MTSDQRSPDHPKPSAAAPGGSERYFRTAFEHAAIGMALVDPDGRLLHVNPSFCRILGRREAELREFTLQDITHAEDWPDCTRQIRRLLAGEIESYRVEQRYVLKDGGIAWVEVACSAAQSADGTVEALITVVTDISERRQGEAARQESEARFRATFEQAAVGMCQATPDGQLLRANQRLCAMLGYSAEELVGRTVYELTHPEDRVETGRQISRLLAGEIAFDTREKRLLHKDGRTVWAEVARSGVHAPDGTIETLITALTDITERKRAEAALRASELRFRLIVEHFRDVLYITTPGATPPIYVSPAYETVWGRPARELDSAPRAWIESIHPDDRPRVLAALAEIAHRPLDVEFRIVRPDGTVRWIHDRAFAVTQGEGARAQQVGIAEDITERKWAEEALRASEARHERIAANVPGMVYQFVYRPDGSKGFSVVSEGVRRLFGLAPEAVLHDHTVLFDLIHPEDRPDFDASGAAVVAALAPWRWEGRMVLPTGEKRWVEVASRNERQPDGSILSDGLLVDVTARRQAAQRLAESEQRLRSLVDHNIDTVLEADLDGRFLSLNPAAEALSGYTAAELVGQPFAPLIVPEHRELCLEHFRRAVEGTPQRYEVSFLDKSGQRVDIMASNVPIVVGGRVVGVFGVIKDVTEQRSLQAQLRQAQKMEAIGRLAGGIAHDFNNLLTAILSHSEFLLGGLADGPARQDAEVIRQTAERAAGLTRQLLAFSRQQIIQPRLVDLNAVVRETKRMLRRTLGDGITLEPDLGAIGSVLADPGQLEQVLVNLALNARDAMPDGGTLTLRTRDVVVDDAFARRHRGLRPGVYVTLAVEDTGVGIPPELQARIFEPFFTTKPVGEGTGLGLATIYGLVKQWGGYTAVQSVPVAGTTFTIYLPRQEGMPEAAAAAPAQPPIGTETVLVVEDEATVRSSIRRILVRHGYTVIEARHGTDALRVIDEATTRIDLVVTDLAMPEMSGRELLAEIRARSAAPRILVISGYDKEAAMRGEALPAGTPFLEKPFTVDGLLRSVRAALDPP